MLKYLILGAIAAGKYVAVDTFAPKPTTPHMPVVSILRVVPGGSIARGAKIAKSSEE